VEKSRQEAEAVLAISRRLDDLVEEAVASYFDAKETSEEERYEAVAWARGHTPSEDRGHIPVASVTETMALLVG